MKKIVLVLATIVVFALAGCNVSTEDMSEISSLLEEISEEVEVASEAVAETSEVSETVSEETSDNQTVSEFVSEVVYEEQTVSESTSASSENSDEEDGYLKGLTVHTMWIQEMTAKEAALDSIWGGEYSDDTKATVVGLLVRTEEGGDHISSTNSVRWYTMENGEYVKLEEATSSGTAPICGDELAVVIGRFPADKVDVNNLYLEISDFSGEQVKYFKVEPDNLFDIYSLEATESVLPEKGEIVYFHDIPFIITASPWESDVSPWDYDMTNYTKRDDPCVDNERTITLMPLTGQINYDFSFYGTVKLSENCNSEDYAVVYTTRWEDQSAAGTIEGNCVNFCFRYMWYYEQAELDAYKTENPNDYYASGFYDEIEDEMRASDILDTYLELENANRPNTILYFLQ